MHVGVIKIGARQRQINSFKKALNDAVNQWELDKKQAPLRAFIRDLERHMISVRRKKEFGVHEIVYFKIKKDAFDRILRKHLS